ncbi:hypothetical protein MMC15_003285 [Xylographa vitiligo]|nr:hypothetical protein [Xylographa vitiligo]
MILLSHFHHAAYLCVLLASTLATYANDLSEHNQTFSHLIPRSRNRRVYFEVTLNLPFGEGTSSSPAHFPAKTAIWIEGAPLEDALKIDLRLVRYPSTPCVTLFTPYVQELHFDFPRLPPGTHELGDWITVQPGVEIFVCAETHVSNREIMAIANGHGILLDRIAADTVLTTELIDPNVFMYNLLMDFVGSSEGRYERLLRHIADSRALSQQKNSAWVAFMPVAVYQAGDGGKYRRYFDIRDAENTEGLGSRQIIPFISSIAGEVMPEAQNPYVASWGTVGMDSSAQPSNWTPEDLDLLSLDYFAAPNTPPT